MDSIARTDRQRWMCIDEADRSGQVLDLAISMNDTDELQQCEEAVLRTVHIRSRGTREEDGGTTAIENRMNVLRIY